MCGEERKRGLDKQREDDHKINENNTFSNTHKNTECKQANTEIVKTDFEKDVKSREKTRHDGWWRKNTN